MPSPARMHTPESYPLDSRAPSVSETSTIAVQYCDSFDEEDDEDDRVLDYTFDQPRRGPIAHLLHLVGWTRPGAYGSLSADDPPDGILRKRGRSRPSPLREIRRCRRSYVGGLCKRFLLLLPVLVFTVFGILHLTQVVVGRARLFWDSEALDNEFLPHWGKPGHAGEGLSGYPTDATRDVIPIPCHSHNDYWRRVPLFDALHWGCTSVEADVWLYDQDLYVGHNTASLTKNRTFQNLYVKPLVELLDRMNPQTEFAQVRGHGVFDQDPERSLVLLVDVKTAGPDSFPHVHDQLAALRERDYLTYWDGERIHSRAVTVVGTGNTPFDMIIQNTTYRDIFFDAPLNRMWDAPNPTDPSSDPQSSDPDPLRAPLSRRQSSSSPQGSVGTEQTSPDDFHPSNSYYASVSFAETVGFVWRGRLSPHQMDTIRGQIRGAKRRGLKVRYWDTPTWPVNKRNHIWNVLVQEGADMLSVDDLKGAAVESWRRRMRDFW